METHIAGTHRIVRCIRCYESAAKHVMETGIAPITRWSLPMPTTAGAMGSAVCHVCGSAGADIQFHATPVRRGTCESAGAAPTPAREMPQLTQPGVALAHWVSSADQDVEPVRIATPTRTCATCGRVATANNVRVLAATDARPPALFGVGLCDICESELSSS